MNTAPEPPKPHAIESFLVVVTVLVIFALFAATVMSVVDAY